MDIITAFPLYTVILVVVSAIYGRLLYIALFNKEPWGLLVIKVLGFMYPIGEALQYAMIGPGTLRWHLSDVGFVALPVAMLCYVPRITWGKYLRWGKRLALASLIIGVSIEVLQMAIGVTDIPIRGDVIDVIIFVIVFIIVYALLWNLERKIVKPVTTQRAPAPKSRSKTKRRRLFRP